MTLEQPWVIYRRGWGPKSADSSDIVSAWTLYIQDINGHPTALTFYVTNDDSPVIISRDIKRYTITDNMSSPPNIIIKIPSDVDRRVLETYMTTSETLKSRLRLLVVPVFISAALLGGSRRPMYMSPKSLAKRIHNLTHGHPDQISRVCQDVGWLDAELENAINTVCGDCESFAFTGPPAPSKKISIHHVNEKFNE